MYTVTVNANVRVPVKDGLPFQRKSILRGAVYKGETLEDLPEWILSEIEAKSRIITVVETAPVVQKDVSKKMNTKTQEKTIPAGKVQGTTTLRRRNR